MITPTPLAERFWSKVDVRGPDECWPWLGTVNNHGYGKLWVRAQGEKAYAHRISFVIHGGALAPGEHVLHSCDNPPCVNPRHLRAGTPADNTRDKIAHGRSNRGERHGHAKLTVATVREIRREWADGTATQRALALHYGVTQSQISMVVNRRTWADVA